ncbi:MAG TPA: aminotransferase class V-fold PLP-dependent enzyme [Saprospiraceae bacterium]|nr:aminotransferase class V-fold PLP-dependent enzyme [Saprospiraceae bacterium]
MNDPLIQIREEFPALKNNTYLNTASSGLLSKKVLEYRRQYDQEYFEKGFSFRKKCLDEAYALKQLIGSTFHCGAEHIGLLPNFSWGMNALAESLSDGRKVLLVHDDYPSLTLPFESRNFQCFYMPTHPLNEETIVHAIEENKPDIWAVSNTQWKDGAHIPAKVFKNIKNRFPGLFIIADATQYLGTQPFHFDESGIDILLTSGYKWMLSGFGNGFVMTSQNLDKQWKLKIKGNNTLMDRFFTGRNHPGQDWEPGHLDMLNFGSMKTALQQLNEIGLDRIEKKINKLSITLKTGLVSMGFLSAGLLHDHMHRNILQIPGSWEWVKELNKNDIEVAYRDGIRISFHFYNTPDEIQRFLKALQWMV